MRRFVWILVVLLAILHWDFWLWDDRSTLYGFLPIGLAYHAGFSITCTVVWAMAVAFCWPKDLERWAEGEDDNPRADSGGFEQSGEGEGLA